MPALLERSLFTALLALVACVRGAGRGGDDSGGRRGRRGSGDECSEGRGGGLA